MHFMAEGDGSVSLPPVSGAPSTNGHGGREQPIPKITWEERDRLDERNSDLLDRDLRDKRLVFESRPYEAHVQFSNFCNMSCIMCWNGTNPPLIKMAPDVLNASAAKSRPTSPSSHPTMAASRPS